MATEFQGRGAESHHDVGKVWRRRGNRWGIAVAESFFSSLMREI